MKANKNNKIIKNLSLIPHYADPLANAELALREYEAGMTNLSTLPLVVTFALTTHCYKKRPCVICDRNTRPESSDSEVDAAIINAAKPLLETASIVLLHCGGEAMFSSYFDEILTTIKPPTLVVFATNAMALTRQRATLMLESGVMGCIVISMDAATPEIYRIMRPSCNFDTVKRNLEYYSAHGRELYGEDAPAFLLNMTICEANIKDVPQFVDLAVELGAAGITLNHLNPGLTHKVETSEGWIWDYKEQERFSSKKQHDELILEAYYRAKDNDIQIVFVGEPFLTKKIAMKNKEIKADLKNFSRKPSKPMTELWSSSFQKPFRPELETCLKAWQEIIIQPNGSIRRCYFHDETQWPLGNICDADIMEIWNSKEMINFRQEFNNKSMSRICNSSQPCIHRGRK